MAGNAIADLIGGLSLISMLSNVFPDSHESATSVRVAAGLSMPGEHDTPSTGGNMPGIALFDEDGGRIGFKSGTRSGSIGDGDYKDILVDPINTSNNRPPTYISISGGGQNPLCIAYIYVTPPSKEFWGFFGDIPKRCGAPWYHSNLPVQATDGTAFKPSCFWIASPDPVTGKTTNNYPQGAGIHLIDFAPSDGLVQQFEEHHDTMCDSAPRFKMYPSLTEMNCIPIFNPPLESNPDGTDKNLAALKTAGQVMCEPGPGTKPSAKQIIQLQQWTSGRYRQPSYGVKKRSTKTRENTLNCSPDHNSIIMSEHAAHTASELCGSLSAAGPDFVSIVEGLFCDMCAKELWPLCSEATLTGCFDLDSKAMRANNGTLTGRGLHARDVLTGRDIPQKEYEKVVHWS
ncbi:uncharacterized protein ACLA_004220 [Aspergillus clavatus NRRL 1]|uniref:Uncharacterized protein n=1 Tax=Aspergillus clavatus (strain ATCC 1007 / CBS 513.65 / DSM 816 / NCTC 3887 / NRRL 1 / QM 1276 / 107) TaxID=344612 RepID=A1C5P0_ASPCL|nr:uncharacterized protein ACLA_004220 [Aspergillus clavatus NRRL 1]EAW15008.1 conserved hypothetical protein [Aspergillus clavatus NRRL 1]